MIVIPRERYEAMERRAARIEDEAERHGYRKALTEMLVGMPVEREGNKKAPVLGTPGRAMAD